MFNMQSSSDAPVTPRDAATIVLVRARGASLEVLLVRRHAASGFMAGALVFPGGKVDAADRDPAKIPAGFKAGRLEPTPGRPLSAEDEAAFFVAACRETREEAGVTIGPDRLVYWAHWITPSLESRRFDTRFFIGEVPADQTAAIDEHEVTELRWMTPDAALAAHESGEIFLPPPTQRTLEELAPCTSFEAIRAAAAVRHIAAIQPKLIASEEGFAILLPWDPDYDKTEGEGLRWTGPVPPGTSRIAIRPR